MSPSRYLCKICGQSFTRRSDVKRHEAGVHKKAKFKCLRPGCNKTFCQRDKLDSHEFIKHQGGKYCCGLCAQHYTDRSTFFRHKKSGHRGQIFGDAQQAGYPKVWLVYRCSVCGCRIKGVDESAIEQHSRSHSSKDDLSYEWEWQNEDGWAEALGEYLAPDPPKAKMEASMEAWTDGPFTAPPMEPRPLLDASCVVPDSIIDWTTGQGSHDDQTIYAGSAIPLDSLGMPYYVEPMRFFDGGPRRPAVQKDLPPSIELAYYRKCIELRRRITDVEENNDGQRLRIQRLNRSIQKMRLERAFLLDAIDKRMEYNIDDSDRSSSPPPTPTDKPLRSKRSHRKATPPPGGPGGMPGQTAVSPSGQQLGGPILHPMAPLSSAQSTPDPSRSAHVFFNPTANSTSPHGAMNGTPQTALPPIHSLPPLQPQRPHHAHGIPPAGGQFYDGAYDDQRGREPEYEREGGRSRAHSGAQPIEPSEAANGEGRGQQDIEMSDAPGAGGFGGFTAVNR